MQSKIDLALKSIEDAKRDLRTFELRAEAIAKQIAETSDKDKIAMLRSDLGICILTGLSIRAEMPAREAQVQKAIKGRA